MNMPEEVQNYSSTSFFFLHLGIFFIKSTEDVDSTQRQP